MKKKALLLALTIFVVIVIVYIASGTTPQEYFETQNPEIREVNTKWFTDSCYDSDGDDIYTDGKITYGSSFLEKVSEKIHDFTGSNIALGRDGGSGDYCFNYIEDVGYSNVGILREGYCEDGRAKNKLITCGEGRVCRYGKCIKGDKDTPKCIDSDGGKDPFFAGEVDRNGIDFNDTCLRGSAIAWKGICEEVGNCFVREYFCEKDQREYEKIACPSSCKEGRCLR